MPNNVVVKNIGWRLLERFGAQGVTFVVSIILARLLDPSTYGLIAIVTVIISILNVFVSSGLGNSLIQKKDADDLDFSSVFYFNVIMCIFLYLLLFIFSSSIASFYNNDNLTLIIKVLGISLLISGFKNIQSAYVSRHLMFKKYFFSTLGGTALSAIISIWMAYKGYGVWALVCQNLINHFVDTIILWITVGWKPKLMFSFSRLKKLFNYGSKMLLSSLLDTIWRQLRQLIIGRKYTVEDLAYYNKGSHFPEAAISSIIVSFDSVLLPVMANSQDNILDVKQLTRKSIRICSFVLWPMMIGLAACSDNLVKLLLTDKWLPAIPYLRIFCISYAFHPIHTSNLNAIKALGRSDIFLSLEIVKKVVGLIIILISMRYGVYAMALSTLISNVISQIINSWPNKKLINYKYMDQIKDITPSLLLSLFMGIIVYCVNFIGLNSFVTLMIQIILGIIIYIGLSYLLKIDSLLFCINIIKKRKND